MLCVLDNSVSFALQVHRESRVKMESVNFINVISIFALNVFFFFSGACLNCVVIISFWRSVQLRKKLCHFMIMLLSCCDLLAVLTNIPLTAVFAMLQLTGKLNLNATCRNLILELRFPPYAFSLLALLVMNFDRYLATSHPLFHRTSVTKKRLLTLLAILMTIEVCLALLSLNKYISLERHLMIFFALVSPPMIFFNFKLFAVVRKNRRGNRVSPEMKKTFSIKNISSCLLAVACYVTSSIPIFVYAGLRINSTESTRLSLRSSAYMIAAWGLTISSMNSSFNCLIFYWKDITLRTEGLKVIKSIKICRQV